MTVVKKKNQRITLWKLLKRVDYPQKPHDPNTHKLSKENIQSTPHNTLTQENMRQNNVKYKFKVFLTGAFCNEELELIYIALVSYFLYNSKKCGSSSTCIFPIHTNNLHLDLKWYIYFHCLSNNHSSKELSHFTINTIVVTWS